MAAADGSRSGAWVVCAAFDDRLDGAVRAVIRTLAAADLPVQDPPRHRPHLTLAAVPAGVPLPQVLTLVGEVSASVKPFALRLDYVGVFPGARSVLWLGTAPDPALDRLHEVVDGAVLDRGWGRPFAATAPGRWVPHCTLAVRLQPQALARAIDHVAASWRPLAGRVDALATLRVGGTGELDVARLSRRPGQTEAP